MKCFTLGMYVQQKDLSKNRKPAMSSAEEKLSQGYVIVSANSIGVTGYYPTGGDNARLFTAEYAARGNVWGGDSVSLRSVGSSMVGDTLEVNEHGVTLTGATNMIFTNKTRRNYRHKRVHTYPNITINPDSFEEPKSLPASRLNMEEVSRFFLGNFSPTRGAQQLPATIGAGSRLGWGDLYVPKTQSKDVLTSQLYAITPLDELPRWWLIHEYFHNRLGWVLWGLYQSGGHPDEIRKQTKKHKADGAATVLGEVKHVMEQGDNYVHLPLVLQLNRFGDPNLWGVSVRGDHYYPVGELYKYSNVPEGSMGYGEWLQQKYGLVELGTQGMLQGALF